MSAKRYLINIFGILIIMFVILPDINAQVESVYKFKNIQIPFNMKRNDSVFEKGKYDFEFLREHTTWYLRIIKNRKVLCTITGVNLEYDTKEMDKFNDPDIPDKPTLKMKRILEESVVEIIFETGKLAGISPMRKASFKIEYEK